MADKDQYTDENAESDFTAGFTSPEKTQPAVVKVEGEGGEEKAEGKTEGEDKTEGDDKTSGTDGGEGDDKTGGDVKTEGAEDETVTVTKTQLERLLAAADKVDGVDSQISKLFGTTGDLKQLVKNLQEATPKGLKVKIPADAFKDMEAEYPEIAAHMRKSLENSLSGLEGTSGDKPAGTGDDKEGKGLKPEAIQAIVDDSVIRREMVVLEEDHPNWRKDVGAVETGQKADPKHPFRVWLSKQPEGYRKKIDDTDSPLVVSRALDKFKAFSEAEKRKTPPPKKDEKKAAAQRDRIDGALKPRGDGNPPPNKKTNDEEFQAGFKSG